MVELIPVAAAILVLISGLTAILLMVEKYMKEVQRAGWSGSWREIHSLR